VQWTRNTWLLTCHTLGVISKGSMAYPLSWAGSQNGWAFSETCVRDWWVSICFHNDPANQQWNNHVNCWLTKAFAETFTKNSVSIFCFYFVIVNRQLQSFFQWSEMVSVFQYHSADKCFMLKLDQCILKLKRCFTSTAPCPFSGNGPAPAFFFPLFFLKTFSNNYLSKFFLNVQCVLRS